MSSSLLDCCQNCADSQVDWNYDYGEPDWNSHMDHHYGDVYGGQ